MSSANSFALSLRPRPGLRYAGCIGRVGALAVALGVGFAVASTPAVAHAEESTNPSQSSNPDPGSPDATDATKSGSPNDSRQSRLSEQRRILRTLGVGANSSGRPERPGRQTASGRDDGQQAKDARDRTDGRGVDGTVSGGTAVDSGNDAGAVVGSANAVAGARGTTIKRSSDDPVRQSVSTRRAPTVRVSQRPVPAAAAPSTAGTSVDHKTVSTAVVQRSITTRSVVASQSPVANLTTSLAGSLAGLRSPTPTPTPAVTRATTAPVPVVSGFLAAVGLAPSLTSPTTPPRAPAAFVWAVLGFVRREIEQAQRTFLNRTPDAREDAVATDEDTTLTFDPRTNDRDDDTLAVTAVTQGAYGNVTTDGTTVTYTPNDAADALPAGETVTDTFTYTVSDESSPSHLHGVFGFFSRGHTDTATVTVTLTGTNDAPTAVSGTANVSEDQVLTGTLPRGADVDGDPLTYVLSTNARHGTVTITDETAGTYTYTPNADFNGTDSFTFVTNDGTTNSVAATVTVTVAAVNDPPVVQGGSTLTIRESETGRLPITVTDVDSGDTYTITFTQGSRGDVDVAGNTVTYVPTAATRSALLAGQTVTDTFTYTVTDSGGAPPVTATVSVVITGEGSTGVLTTGEWAPVDLELDGDRGVIRYDDGTLGEFDYSDEDGWTVGAGVDYGFDVGDLALDGRWVYAEVEADDFDDGTMAVVDLDTGDVVRVTDRTGVAYQFGEVTDVAVDRRVETADVVYAVDSRGTVYEIDAQSREMVRSAETRSFEFRTADAAAVSASPKLAVAQGSKTVYVADGSRISVVQKQTVRTARLAGEGEAAAAETEQLVHMADLDVTLEPGNEITTIEVGEDGTLYATVVSTGASASAVSGARLVRINVDAQSGRLLEGESVLLRSDATSLSISDDLDRAYVGSAEGQSLSVVGLRRLDVLDVVQTGVATGVAVAPGTNTVLVANPDAHTISLVRQAAVTTDAPINITLDWGSQPLDLDAHLVGATDDGTFHVSYLNRTWSVEDQTGAVLDVDDRDGDGPEHIALNRMSPGTYLFYVDNFSNDGGLIGSATNVTIQDQRTGRTLYTFDVPARGADDTGAERYWSVFTMTIDGDGTATITPVTGDPLGSTEPTLPHPPTPPPGSEIYY